MKCIMLLMLLLLLLFEPDTLGMEVLMVIGGRYLDHTRQTHVELSSVEVVGPRGVCALADMPEPRHGHTAGLLGDSVYVCGGLSGKHIHEREECLIYSLTEGVWKRMDARPPKGLAFSSMAVGKNAFYLVGGRESLYKTSQDRPWESSSVVMEYSRLRRQEEAWRYVTNMTKTGSDGCAGIIGQNLWYIGDKGAEILRNGERSWTPIQLEFFRNETQEAMVRQWNQQINTVKAQKVPDEADERSTGNPVQFKFKEKKAKKKDKIEILVTELPQVIHTSGFIAWDEKQRLRELTEERQRKKEEERRRKNLEKLERQTKPPSIWDQIRNVFDKGSKGVDEILNKVHEDEPVLVRRKRQVTRAPWVEDYTIHVTRAQWSDGNQDFSPPGDQRGQGRQGEAERRDWREARRDSTRGRNSEISWNEEREERRKETYPPGRLYGGGTREAVKEEEQFYPAPTRPPLGGGERLVPRPEERMVGQGCLSASINGEEGVLLAGGVWEGGRKVAWVPLERPGAPLLEVLADLEEARRWRPGVGRIAGRIAVAGGGDWGSDTIEVLDTERKFKLLVHKLEQRRENTAAVTVQSSYFKSCKF